MQTRLQFFCVLTVISVVGCGDDGGDGSQADASAGGSDATAGGSDAAIGNVDAAFTTIGDPGDTCEDTAIVPVQIPAQLPYADIGQTTCTGGTRYSTTCMGPFWSAGEDVVYKLEVTEPTSIEVRLDANDTRFAGLALDATCPIGEEFDTCIAMSLSDDSVEPLSLGCHALDPGTYWVMVSVFPSPDCIPDFDLTILDC